MTTVDDAKLEVLMSRMAIEDLITTYAIALDSRDLETAVMCFRPDGEFRSVGGTIRGRDAIREYYGGRLAGWGPTFHVPHRAVVTFEEPGRASGTVIAHSEIMTAGKLYLAAHHYHDVYVQDDDRAWRFESREVLFIYSKPLDELAAIDPSQPRRSWPGAESIRAEIPESLPTYERFLAARADASERQG
jgi:uncharacterized protein (TIGR02246 family)